MTKTDPYTEKVLKEFRKEFVQDHNRGEERFLRGLFIEEFEEFITQALLTQREEIKERIEGLKHDLTNHTECVSKSSGCDCPREVFNEALTAASLAVDGEK